MNISTNLFLCTTNFFFPLFTQVFNGESYQKKFVSIDLALQVVTPAVLKKGIDGEALSKKMRQYVLAVDQGDGFVISGFTVNPLDHESG